MVKCVKLMPIGIIRSLKNILKQHIKYGNNKIICMIIFNSDEINYFKEIIVLRLNIFN